MASLLGAFNAQLVKFIEDISNVLKPEDAAEARRGVKALKLTLNLTPAIAVRVWLDYARRYARDIETGDIESFIRRNYKDDLKEQDASWLDACERIRKCAIYLSPSNQDKTMKYVQLLTKLANMYQAEKAAVPPSSKWT